MLQSKEALDLLGYFDCKQTIFVNPTKNTKISINISKTVTNSVSTSRTMVM